jgi:Na+/proline symporter
VSSVTFVSVPAAVFRDGGNMTYLQVVIGLALGKLFIGAVLARDFFAAQDAQTTYDYIGARLGRATGRVSLGLGLALGFINSAIKLLTAAIVLDVITRWGIPACALTVTAIGLLWSALAGLKTVIWTDFLLFALFSVGAVLALIFLIARIDLDLPTALASLDAQAKTVLFDFSTDPQSRYTLWAALAGSVALSLAVGGTQATWQRVRACRSAADACKAYNWSAAFYLLHLVMLAIGAALVLFYSAQPLPAEVAAEVTASPDRILPHFIITEIPVGLSGLLIAAIFAAAISTLDSALTEAADLTVRHLYEPLAGTDRSERHYLAISRLALALWSLAFAAGAIFLHRYAQEGLLDLTFKLPNYLYGAVLGTILLARMRSGRFATFAVGFVIALAITAVLASSGVAFFWWCPVSGAAMVIAVRLLESLWPGTMAAGQGGHSEGKTDVSN